MSDSQAANPYTYPIRIINLINLFVRIIPNLRFFLTNKLAAFYEVMGRLQKMCKRKRKKNSQRKHYENPNEDNHQFISTQQLPNKYGYDGNEAMHQSGSERDVKPNDYREPKASCSYSTCVFASKKHLSPGLCGLTNLGNSCYMNAGLQCLLNIPIFKHFALNYKQKSKLAGNNQSLFAAFSKLTKYVWSADYQYYIPITFMTQLSSNYRKYGHNRQNDCGEFMLDTLTAFHNQLNHVSPLNASDYIIASNDFTKFRSDYMLNNNSFISDSFHGFQRFSLKCFCGKILTQNISPFAIIHLPKASVDDMQDMVSGFSSDYSDYNGFMELPFNLTLNNPSLNDCFDFYLKPKLLSDNQKMFCDKCDDSQTPTECLEILHFPKILMIKIRSLSPGKYFYNPVEETYIEFPFILSLSKYMNENDYDRDLVYDLVAVAHHSGGVYGGHYWTTARNEIDKNWYLFNDSQVTKIDPLTIIKSTAYLLIYVKSHE